MYNKSETLVGAFSYNSEFEIENNVYLYSYLVQLVEENVYFIQFYNVVARRSDRDQADTVRRAWLALPQLFLREFLFSLKFSSNI